MLRVSDLGVRSDDHTCRSVAAPAYSCQQSCVSRPLLDQTLEGLQTWTFLARVIPISNNPFGVRLHRYTKAGVNSTPVSASDYHQMNVCKRPVTRGRGRRVTGAAHISGRTRTLSSRRQSGRPAWCTPIARLAVNSAFPGMISRERSAHAIVVVTGIRVAPLSRNVITRHESRACEGFQ